ncbi:hypothetical protein BGW39_009106 [Mortierella sp. 14UC]|nr:hypothetical protein BGW39_009106 [Mortierella sp. 14UC]
MPPKKRPVGSAISNNTQEEQATNVATSTGSTFALPRTQQLNSAGPKDLADEQEKRPSKKPRSSPGKKPVVIEAQAIAADATHGQEQHHSQVNADEEATANRRTMSGQEHHHHHTEHSVTSESSQPNFTRSTNIDNASTQKISLTPSVKKPFKPRGPRGPYKPRQPKTSTAGTIQSRAATNVSALKPNSDLAFKDTRPWHDYFTNRIPSFNEVSSAWEFCPLPPREDVLTPEELDKMIADDYARMKPLPSDDKGGNNLSASHHDSVGNGGAGTQDEMTETSAHTGKTKKRQEEIHERSQDAESDSQWDDSGSDPDNHGYANNRHSRSLTPGASAEGTGNGDRRRRASKHRPRIKYRFPAPIPPLEYPYLQSSFPYEGYQPPKQQLSTQPDYGDHSQPLADLWHRPQGSFAMEDLFSQDKLDYSIRMLRKQPIESNKLRLDLYYRRGFQLAAKQVLDRARVAYYGRHDHTNRHTLQVPNLFNEVDEARLRSSKRSRKDINILRSLGIEEKVVHREYSLLSTSPTIADVAAPALAIPVAAMGTFSGTPTSGSSLSSTTLTKHAGSSASRVSQSQSQITSDSDDREEAIARERMAYYEVNQFLATMFNHRNIGGKVARLSPRACIILRTLMGGLEKKLISMGCKLQRAELTRRLAEIDTFLSNRTREMNRARKEKQRTERDGSHSGELASLTSLLPARSPSPMPVTTPTPVSPSKEPMGSHATTAYEKPFYPLLDVDPVEYYIRTATSHNPHDPRLTMVAIASAPQKRDQEQVGRDSLLIVGPSKSVDASQQREPSAMTSSTNATMTTAESGLPFITNPLRIPDEMEPFWRVRNYVERMSAASAAPTTSHISEIERLRQAQRDISASEPSIPSLPLLGVIDSRHTETDITNAVSPHSPSAAWTST